MNLKTPLTLNVFWNTPEALKLQDLGIESETHAPELGDEFRFEENQNTRDGLFEDEQLFAVFDNEDIQQVIDKLKRCLK